MKTSIYQPEDMRAFHQQSLDRIVQRHSGDDRSRKWVKIREDIIDHFKLHESAEIGELNTQIKVLREKQKQGSLF